MVSTTPLAPLGLEGDRVANNERSTENNGKPCPVVGKRPLHGDRGAEGGRAGQRYEGRDGDSEVAERDDNDKSDEENPYNVADEAGKGRVQLARVGETGHPAAAPSG